MYSQQPTETYDHSCMRPHAHPNNFKWENSAKLAKQLYRATDRGTDNCGRLNRQSDTRDWWVWVVNCCWSANFHNAFFFFLSFSVNLFSFALIEHFKWIILDFVQLLAIILPGMNLRGNTKSRWIKYDFFSLLLLLLFLFFPHWRK